MMMPASDSSNSEDSVSDWIADMKEGDTQAVASLWDRYFDRICQFADRRLGGVTRSVIDEQDLAVIAMRAVWEGARSGRFKRLENREDLWQLLVVITSRKAANLRRDQAVRKSYSLATNDPNLVNEFMELMKSPPSDALIDQIPLSCRELLAMLDPRHRSIAMMRLAGHSNFEISQSDSSSVATVERCLRRIRQTWAAYDPRS